MNTINVDVRDSVSGFPSSFIAVLFEYTRKNPTVDSVTIDDCIMVLTDYLASATLGNRLLRLDSFSSTRNIYFTPALFNITFNNIRPFFFRCYLPFLSFYIHFLYQTHCSCLLSFRHIPDPSSAFNGLLLLLCVVTSKMCREKNH